MRVSLFVLRALVPLAIVASAAAGQGGPAVIVVSASAEVEVVPDRARLRVGVETRAATAAEASAANARLQTSVLAAVRRAGVSDAQLRTQSVAVRPVLEYPREGGRPTVAGYVASNSVEIRVYDLAKLAGIIDASLNAGATNLDGPHLEVADESEPRRRALDAAVRNARADAEAIARAAGVQILSVLEIRSGGAEVSTMMASERLVEIPNSISTTPVETGRISVDARVTIRFAIGPK